MTVFSSIDKYISCLRPENLAENRKKLLIPLAQYIRHKIENHLEIRLQFICTHNSRRSLLAQVWAQTMGHYFNIKLLNCYSGGTERTELFPVVAETLKTCGFTVDKITEATNPVYMIKYDCNEHPVMGFSKKFDDAFNPASGFAAVMTCNDADENCPYVSGAENRFVISYDDPKAYDLHPGQTDAYLTVCNQIATEMYFIFNCVKV